MNTNSVAVGNFETGEMLETNLKLPDTKFGIRGHKMYNNGVLMLIDVLTKAEMAQTIELFDSKSIDYNNLLVAPFHKLTKDFSKAARSRYKRKLLDNSIAAMNGKQMMLNPYIFIPRGDKNIQNSKHLTQRVWKYMFEDADAAGEDVIRHAEHMFGPSALERTHLSVGSGDYQHFLPKPKELT